MKKITNENGRVRVQTINEQPTKTQQQFKDTVDINRIMSKYLKTGDTRLIETKTGVYADITQITDLHDSMNKVIKANESFNALPSNLRKRFSNDPQQLIDFLSDANNIEESIKLGLRLKPKVEAVGADIEANPEPK